MADANVYALAMQLTIDQTLAGKAISTIMGQVKGLEEKISEIGQKLVDALDLSGRKITLPEIPSIEIPISTASIKMPKIEALEMKVKLSLVDESKKKLDEKLRTNVESVIRAAVAAGFGVLPSIPAVSVEAEVQKPELKTGPYGMGMPAAEEMIPPAMRPIRIDGTVEPTIDPAAKKALDAALEQNIARTVNLGMAMGVKRSSEAVSGAKLESDAAVAAIYERIKAIREAGFELLHAKDVEAFKVAFDEVGAAWDEINKGPINLIPWKVFDDLIKAKQDIFGSLMKSLVDYQEVFATTASEMMDFEVGRIKRSSDNIAIYMRQGRELEKQVSVYDKLKATGVKFSKTEEEIYDTMKKQFDVYKKRKPFLQDELEAAKKLEAHQRRMQIVGQELLNIGQQGYMSWLFIDIVTGGERLKTVFGAIKKGIGGIAEAGKFVTKSVGTGFGKLGGLLKGIFKKEDVTAGMAGVTGALKKGATDSAAAVKGPFGKMWASIKNIFKGGAKETEAATKGMAISPPAADPAGSRIKTWLTNVGEGLKNFMKSMGAISPVAILKFALLGVVLLGLVAGLILLASWLAKLGAQGVVALLAISAAAIALAVAMAILAPALAAIGAIGSIAIPIILSLAVAVAALALVVYAATAFVTAMTSLFTVFKDNISAGFAFVGFLAALGVALVVAGAGIAAFGAMFAVGMVGVAAGVAIGAALLVPAMLFYYSMSWISDGVNLISKSFERLGAGMGLFTSSMSALVASLTQIPTAVAGFAAAMTTLVGSIYVFAAQMIPMTFAMGFIVEGLKSFAGGMTDAMVLLGVASVFGAPAVAFMNGLASAVGMLGDALTKVGTDAGKKISDIASGLRDLATIQLGPEVMMGMVFAAVGIGALGDAAATAAPRMLAVADAGTAITTMVDDILARADDFAEAANVIEQFRDSIGTPTTVGVAGPVGPFGALGSEGMVQGLLAKVRGEPIAPVRTVTDDGQKKALESRRQMNEALAAIKGVIESLSGKIDAQTVKDIKGLLDTHLPRIAEGGTGAPVDDINRWK